MPYPHPFPSLRADQRGAVAITAVIGMTLITLTMGLALADIALREDAKSRNNYETEQAFASASGCTEYALQMLKMDEDFNSPYDAFGSGLVTGDTECYTEITPAVPPINGRLIGQGKRGNKVRKIVTDYLEAGPAPATRLPLDVVLALDRSNSMTAASIIKMQQAATDFVELLNFTGSTADSDRVAVVTFTIELPESPPYPCNAAGTNNRACLNQFLTINKPNILNAIGDITLGGQTNIEGALVLAKWELNNGRAGGAVDHNVVVLMSDGMANYRNEGAGFHGCSTCPDFGTETCSSYAINAADDIRSYYLATTGDVVEIYSVSYNFGTLRCPSTNPDPPTPSQLRNAEDTLQKIANGPVYYLAADASNLIETFEAIAKEVTQHRLHLSSWREE